LHTRVEALHGPPHASAIDSLDAQSLLVRITEKTMRPPDIWRHERSGALSCAYDGGENVFSWSAGDVAGMARRWRESRPGRPPQRVRRFGDAHERLLALVKEAGLEPADAIVHDLRRGEVRAVWEDNEVVVVVDGIGESE
jgi:hypothetical protein